MLLGWTTEQHDTVRDAIKSMRLFNYYHQLQATPGMWLQAQQLLMAPPPDPSFARLNPTYDGVCMGTANRALVAPPFSAEAGTVGL